MSNGMRGVISRLGIIGELFEFLWLNKKWWLIPMVVVLVMFAVLLVFASASTVGPFIYTLF